MIPYEFILDFLYPLPFRTKKMFGTVAIYAGPKIVLAVRQREENPIDNGIWISIQLENQNELKRSFPSLRNLETYKIRTWLLLPETANDFEEIAKAIAEMIKANSPLIGTVPKPKKYKG